MADPSSFNTNITFRSLDFDVIGKSIMGLDVLYRNKAMLFKHHWIYFTNSDNIYNKCINTEPALTKTYLSTPLQTCLHFFMYSRLINSLFSTAEVVLEISSPWPQHN